MEKENAVILGAGDFPKHPIPLRLLREAERVVCCDGAAKTYIEKEGCLPWRIVGDGDSLTPELRERYHDIVRSYSEQENNDQTKATLYLKEHGICDIVYLGATGRREDHTIGNVSLLMEYMKMGLRVKMFTDDGVFIPVKDYFSHRMLPECLAGAKAISIFSFGAKGLKGEGLMYPLYDFTNWWQGTLNRVVDTSFSIAGDGNFLLFFPYCSEAK